MYISPNLTESEYRANEVISYAQNSLKVNSCAELHLATSMRSFRAENVSTLIKQVLDLDIHDAQATLAGLSKQYPIVLTRDLAKAKSWVRQRARGTERDADAVRIAVGAIADVRRPVSAQSDPVALHGRVGGVVDVEPGLARARDHVTRSGGRSSDDMVGAVNQQAGISEDGWIGCQTI